MCPQQKVLEILRPVHLYSWALGVASFQIKKKRDVLSVSRVQHGVLQVALKLVLMLFVLLPVIETFLDPYQTDSLTLYVDTIQTMALCACVWWDVVTVALMRGKVVLLIQNIITAEYRLDAMGRSIDRRYSRTIVKLLIISWPMFVILQTASDIFIIYPDRVQDVIVAFVYNLSLLIGSVVNAQFISILFIIKKQFEALNAAFVHACRGIGAVPEGPLLRLQAEHRRALRDVLNVHHDVCTNAKAAGGAFSPHLTVLLPFYFTSLCNQVYYASVTTSTKHSVLTFFLFNLCWILRFLLEILLIFSTCHFTKQQGDKLAILVNKNYIKHNKIHMQPMLRMAYLQLLHQHVVFRIIGMFTLDLASMSGMISTSMIYVVVLLQFYKNKQDV